MSNVANRVKFVDRDQILVSFDLRNEYLVLPCKTERSSSGARRPRKGLSYGKVIATSGKSSFSETGPSKKNAFNICLLVFQRGITFPPVVPRFTGHAIFISASTYHALFNPTIQIIHTVLKKCLQTSRANSTRKTG